ncbi:uncharacterized protein LOC130628981 isoform X2 [Hydractinia symbiolongicarpus]|uniref:uncharacterized protein LOC130628981 isoform X2 n=1 Tax=Hydractinia symbiolongicarpus TaxID=13093 RepID=UPI00254C0771|nr:uncharacterized protein LOC130628981 isoform X2 [Hydractinia symbiolongicarpus]
MFPGNSPSYVCLESRTAEFLASQVREMSFRKRSIRPNLSLSKRVTLQPDKTVDSKEKIQVKEEEINCVVKTENEDMSDKDKMEKTSVPKKLSKRVKVMPKLRERSNVKNTPAIIIPVDDTSLVHKQEHVDKSCNADTTLVVDKCELGKLESIEDIELQWKNNLPPVENFVVSSGASTHPSNGVPAGNKLKKRCKVTPTLIRRNTRVNNSDNSDSEVITARTNLITSEENIVICDNNESKASPVYAENDTKISLHQFTVKKLDDVSTDSRLSEHAKNLPKINIYKDSTLNKQPLESEQKIERSIIAASPKDKTMINSAPASYMKPSQENDDEPMLKKVRFTEEDEKEIDYKKSQNNLQLFSEICLAESGSDNRQEKCDVTCKDSKDIPHDNSQSDSEMSTKLNFAKKKSFQPNLGAKRRNRLSSFSAYSSCDEDSENISTKRKKKKSATKPSSNTNINKEKKTQKKKNKDKEKKKKKEEIQTGEESATKKPKETKNMNCSAERDLSTLTMQELIYYRPRSFKTAELRLKKDPVEEGSVVEIGSLLQPVNDGANPDSKVKKNDDEDNEEEDVMAPQVMIDENGEIIINEESLTIKKKVDDSVLRNSKIVYEDALSFGTNRRKTSRGKRWKLHETLRFYKALSQIGTDFTLMSQAFGKFTRNELKKKFKQEERVNCDLVDRALANRLPLNMEMFLRGKEELRDLLNDDASETTEPTDENEVIDNTTNEVSIENEAVATSSM